MRFWIMQKFCKKLPHEHEAKVIGLADLLDSKLIEDRFGH